MSENNLKLAFFHQKMLFLMLLILQDVIPNALSSSVVITLYANYQIGYLGETYYYLHERVKEYSNQHHIFSNIWMKIQCAIKNVMKPIIRSLTLIIEALHNNWIKQQLNKQFKYLVVSISI